MATSGRSEPGPPPAGDVAARVRDAGLVRVVSGATGDGLAATGTLLGAFESVGVAYQAAVVPIHRSATRDTEADLTIAVDRSRVDADPAGDAVADDAADDGPPIAHLAREPSTSASERAYDVARELGDPAPVLALAGAIAAGREPTGAVHEDAVAAGVDRRPGLAVPVADPVDGLAHATLVHGPFSGDEDAAREAVDAIDYPTDDAAVADEDRRRLASHVTLSVLDEPDAPARAAHAIERALRPRVGGPVETVGGFADVLESLAALDPGLGLAVAARTATDAPRPEQVEAALARWREHGSAVATAVRTAATTRHDGLYVAEVDVSRALPAIARLLGDFRSPEPVVLVVGEGWAVARARDRASTPHVGEALREATAAVGGRAAGTTDRARASIDDGAAFVDAAREVL